MSFLVLCGQTWAIQETPINIPKIEGSKALILRSAK
jgi:hypothetical protein